MHLDYLSLLFPAGKSFSFTIQNSFTLVTGTLQIWFNARNTLSHGDIVRLLSFSSYNQEEWTAVSWSYFTLASLEVWGFLASEGIHTYVWKSLVFISICQILALI